MKVLLWLRLYRPLMRFAHKFHWHYAPPLYPDGDTVLWCQWCGFRAVVRRGNKSKELLSASPPAQARP